MNWVIRECLIFLGICLLFLFSPLWAQRGFIRVPIADLIGDCLGASAYTQLPYCGSNPDPFTVCPRMHQLLLHEPVEIIKEKNQQVCIKTSHLFFITKHNRHPHNLFWTLKKNIQTGAYDNLPCRNASISLLHPFFSPKTKLAYSAGTAFAIKKITKNTVVAWLFNAAKSKFETIIIPKNLCLLPVKEKNEKRTQFVKLCRLWATQDFIPYVWGGTSYVEKRKDNFFIQEKVINNKKLAHVAFANEKKQKAGLDCTGLIWRAAQMCTIPFYYKNTTTIAHYLKPVKNKKHLQEGDIIWIRGHVMIVGSLKDNTLIEARGYNHGYGKVQEIPLHTVFKYIKTFGQLFTHQQKKLPFFRMNSRGKVVQTIHELKILRLF